MSKAAPKKGRKAASGATPQQNFRLGAETIADLDAIAAYLATESGRKPSRSDAIRWAARQARRHLPGAEK